MALTEFDLLKSVSVPNVGPINTCGLTVVTGPNSCGKTQFLTDIRETCHGAVRELVVCSSVELEKPAEFEGFVKLLVKHGAITQTINEKGVEIFKQASPSMGDENSDWQLSKSQFKYAYNSLTKKLPSNTKTFYEPLGRTLVTALFLRRRLITTDTVGSFDYEMAQPQNELQALYLNEDAQVALTQELGRTFNRAVWLDGSRGGNLCLRVSDDSHMPPADERLQPEKMKQYRTIDSEGDGLKSYAAICLSLLLGQRPICLIDEPEMCLHPPQAYSLGRFIGKHGTSVEHSTFVATHSSHILRGIIEETEKLQVLRLSKNAGRFAGDLIPYEALRECVERPSTKAETILDGIFSEAVCIVESEGDRSVYEAATESLGGSLQHDVHFVSVGGIGGFASTIQLYQKLKIPTVVISDLDLISKSENLKKVLLALAPQKAVDEIIESAEEVVVQVRTRGPELSPEELLATFERLSKHPMDWNVGDNEKLRKELISTGKKLADLSRLKHGGRNNYEENIALLTSLDALLAACRRHGLFLVPVGELEHWCSELMRDGPSRTRKSEWANEAAIRIRANPEGAVDVCSFMRAVTQCQRDQANRYAGYQT